MEIDISDDMLMVVVDHLSKRKLVLYDQGDYADHPEKYAKQGKAIKEFMRECKRECKHW